MTRHQHFSLLLLVGAPALFAQSGPAVIGAGFLNPAVFRVAPGQVVTVFVNNVKTLLPLSPGTPIRVQRATSLPLPNSLAGFSVRVRQGDRIYPAPIFSVQQVPICAYTIQNPIPPSTADCWVTGLMIQIPFEIVPQPIPNPNPITTTLIATEGQTDSTAIAVFPYRDNIHVLTACGLNALQGTTEDQCGRIVTHADGTLISAIAPAKPGETVVVYAFGLGQTTPAMKTGEAAPTPAPVLGPSYPNGVRTVDLQFDFRVNAGPSRPYLNPLLARPLGLPVPEFVGLTPGQVGLYQINVRLPDIFPPIEPCTGAARQVTGLQVNTVQSNLTIDISGVSSFDGAAICVQPPQ